MAQTVNSSLVLFEQTWDGKALLDENSFYNHRLGKPDMLTGAVTFLYGSKFPLALRTHGGEVVSQLNGMGSGSTVKELNDIQYHYPVMGQQFKAATIATTNSGSQVGRFGAPFTVVFTDNWITPKQLVQFISGTQAVASSAQPRQVTGGFEYTFTIVGDDDAFVPSSDLIAGRGVAPLFTPVAESESRGTEARWIAPGQLKNQMGLIRKSFQWAGNTAFKPSVYKYIVNTNGNPEEGTFWLDNQLARWEYEWLMEVEHMYFYSKYNRNVNGTVINRDDITGKSLPLGAGLIDQIVNNMTYVNLTYDLLRGMVRDALYGQYDQADRKVVIYTGLGGREEIDRILKAQGNAQGIIAAGNINDKFVKGEESNLRLTGFFNSFAMIDGYEVEIRQADIFDYGMLALASPKHPVTLLPLESYRMLCIDESTYDGESNIQIVTEKGRRMLHGIVTGLTNIPASLKAAFGTVNGSSMQSIPQISSDVDKAGYHRLAVGGVALKRANTSFHLRCVAGL